MTPTPFSLDDDPGDGTLLNETTFSNLVAGGSRSVTEDGETGWTLTNIVCTGATTSTVVIGAAGGFNAGDNSVTIGLAAGENIVCYLHEHETGLDQDREGRCTERRSGLQLHGERHGYDAESLQPRRRPGDATLLNERTFGALLPNGVRTVTEDGETGWTLTNIVCTGATSSTVVIGAAGGFNAGDNSVNVTLAAGENIVCTFTNSKLGSIKIVKDAVPNDPQDFSYTASGDGMTPTPFSLDDDPGNATLLNEQLFSGLSAGGSRTVTEDGETGWTLTNIVCTGATTSTVVIGAAGGFNAGDNSVTIGLADGENIICTFTNTKQGSIKIVKDAVPNDAQDFSFTASGTGMTPSPFDLDDDPGDATLLNERTFGALLPNGVRTVTEDGETGWTLTNIVCTGATSSTVVIGAAGGFNAGDNSVNVTLAAGENIVCTFTNTKHGSIKIVKDAVPNDAQDFGYTASGTGMTPSPFSLDDDPGDATLLNERTFGALLPNGNRTVTETPAVTGWVLTNIVCTGATSSTVTIGAAGGFNAGDVSVTIGLSAGENIICTFTNTKQGKVQVVKTFNGGAITGSETFTFTLRSGANATTVGTTLETIVANSTNGGTLNFTTFLTPGASYQICEVVLPGWSSTISGLAGAFTIQTEPDGDNSTICVPFTTTPGQTVVINIDNTPPPGGDARTIGFWKNWASCKTSSGNQAPILDQTLALGAILVGDLLVDTVEAVRILNKSTINNAKKWRATRRTTWQLSSWRRS